MPLFMMLLFGYLAYQYSKKGKMIRAFVCAFISFVALTRLIDDNHKHNASDGWEDFSIDSAVPTLKGW